MPVDVRQSNFRTDRGGPRSPTGQAAGDLPESRTRAAVAAWSAALGERWVSAASEVLDRYGRTTGTHAHRPVAVLHPESTSQVQRVVAIAAEHEIPVYPISRGKNWGYGDAAPVGPGQAVIVLGRMNQIVEVDAKLGYAVIEPGVTQGQPTDRLKKNLQTLFSDQADRFYLLSERLDLFL